jgi:ubiquinone/menaquinone biosynthesis C-methylase UbiE
MSTYFDQRAQDWDANPARAERARIVAAAMRQRLPLSPNMAALEYGCGTGLLSFALQPYLGHITLADSSAGMLAVLREKLEAVKLGNMTPRQLDLATDPLPAERFDLLYTLMTLHHIPETEPILASFHALLNPSGYLCIADLDKEDGSFHGPGFDGHNGFERADLTKSLEKAGFNITSYAIIYTVSKEIAGKNQDFPLFLITASKR